MRFATILLALVLLSGAQAAPTDEESFQGALQRSAGAAHPSQYSFAELYRVTLSGPALGGGIALVPAHDAPVRVAAVPAPAQFSIAEVRERPLGLLLLSGVALAVWVGRRRLGYGW